MNSLILDLGCGAGDSWRTFGISPERSTIIGVDLNGTALDLAHRKYHHLGWRYLRGRGERLPLAGSIVDCVLCSVALPYMHIPETLAEIHRVLSPGGLFRATLHGPAFTWGEFCKAFPRLKATLYRLFVFANGLVLHLTGRVLTVGGKSECCQTERGMEKALQKAGFAEIKFWREGVRWFMEAKKRHERKLWD